LRLSINWSSALNNPASAAGFSGVTHSLLRFHNTSPSAEMAQVLSLPHPHFWNQSLPTVLAQPCEAQYLAINPVADPSKPPQKMTVSAGKTTFPPNYFCNRLPTFPTPTPTSPLFYRRFAAVWRSFFAMQIVPTVGMTNWENML
jgi:hypothetical protein